MKYLGLDLGSKTLGIAISDGIIASGYTTLYFKDEDYDSLLKELEVIVKKEKIDVIVLGLPKNMNNTIGERAEITLKFKESIENKLDIKVIMEDERLTSVIANNYMISGDMSRKKRKQKVDKLAAEIILQTYLDRKGN